MEKLLKLPLAIRLVLAAVLVVAALLPSFVLVLGAGRRGAGLFIVVAGFLLQAAVWASIQPCARCGSRIWVRRDRSCGRCELWGS